MLKRPQLYVGYRTEKHITKAKLDPGYRRKLLKTVLRNFDSPEQEIRLICDRYFIALSNHAEAPKCP